MNKDYYKTLNINRSSSQDEIKKSFRTLSKKHHPDKGGDENTFKEIAEAYDTLGDTNKREKYNHKLDNPFSNGNDVNMEDVFNNFFRQNQHRQQVKRGRNLSIPLTISLEDVIFGKIKKLRYNRKTNCGGCSGSGGNTKMCGNCNGRGVIEQAVGNAFFRQVRRTQCPVCRGNGKEIINACNRCGGSGQDTKEQIIDFTIPKNLMTGQVYTFRGMGEEIGNGHPGDLQIQVVVSRHEQFKVSDKDLIYEPQITILDILLGRILEVPYFGTYLNTTIPQCSSPTTTFKINGKGLERGDGTSGDILVKPKIIMPNRLTPQEQQILRNLNNSENFIKTI
jgi:molecular chaperone DnaJ